jgi:hypothetical protein
VKPIYLVICLFLVGCGTASTFPDKFQKRSSSHAVEVFKRAGLEVGETWPMKKPKDYGLGPTVAIEGTRFLIPSLGEDKGGRVLSFSSKEDLEKSRRYFDELGKASAAFWSWLYVKDNLLLQINGELPEEKAKQYEQALNSLK